MPAPPAARPTRSAGTTWACVLGHIHRDGALTRAELTQRLGVSRSTVGALVADLTQLGLVDEEVPGGGARRRATVARGRPAPLGPVRRRRRPRRRPRDGRRGRASAGRSWPGDGADRPTSSPEVVRPADRRRDPPAARGRLPDAWPAGIGVSVPGHGRPAHRAGRRRPQPRVARRPARRAAGRARARTGCRCRSATTPTWPCSPSTGAATPAAATTSCSSWAASASAPASSPAARSCAATTGTPARSGTTSSTPPAPSATAASTAASRPTSATARCSPGPAASGAPTEAAVTAVYADAAQRRRGGAAQRARRGRGARACHGQPGQHPQPRTRAARRLAGAVARRRPARSSRSSLGRFALETQGRTVQVLQPALGADSALLGAAEIAFTPLLNDPLLAGRHHVAAWCCPVA